MRRKKKACRWLGVHMKVLKSVFFQGKCNEIEVHFFNDDMHVSIFGWKVWFQCDFGPKIHSEFLQKHIFYWIVEIWEIQDSVYFDVLWRSRRVLWNEHLVAKIGVDTAENEPSKVWMCTPITSLPLFSLFSQLFLRTLPLAELKKRHGKTLRWAAVRRDLRVRSIAIRATPVCYPRSSSYGTPCVESFLQKSLARAGFPDLRG